MNLAVPIRYSALLLVCGVTCILTGCTPLETTVRSTVADDLDTPVTEVFVATENEKRPYLLPSSLNTHLTARLRNTDLTAEGSTYDPLALDQKIGITMARDAGFPFALILSFTGGKIEDQQSLGVPSQIDVDASLYNVETETRVWRAAIDAVKTDAMEAMLADKIIATLRSDGVIAGQSSDSDDSGNG